MISRRRASWEPVKDIQARISLEKKTKTTEIGSTLASRTKRGSWTRTFKAYAVHTYVRTMNSTG